jgi:hypothetical protein
LGEYLAGKKKLGSYLKTEKMVNCHSSKAKAHKFSKKSKRARERERRKNLIKALMRGHSAKPKTKQLKWSPNNT